jgi:DNA-directed RNA polymerase specialized sigma24 family protein
MCNQTVRQGLRRLQAVFEKRPAPQVTDRQLLERFASGRDESAFATLVRRHGGMVLGVCRRVLGDERDAQNVFQATFLVLARAAMSWHWQQCVADWLHATAYQLASNGARTRVGA